jgi:hypothetical protein
VNNNLVSGEPGALQEGLRRTCAPGSSAHNLPLPVDERSLLQAMRAAERYASRMRV